MEKTINFAVIGTGQMAAAMMDAFRYQANIKVVAVCGNAKDRVESFAKKYGIASQYTDLDALLKQVDIQAVYIANSTERHAPTTIAALKSGKAVLCEKPIAISAIESEQIESEAAKAKQLCMETMWTHLLPAYQQLFALNARQALGQAQHLYADFGYPVNQKAYPRLFTSSIGSGVLLDRAVYPIALAIKLFGVVKQVKAQVNYNQDGVDTAANLLLLHANGAQSQLVVSVESLLQNKAVLSCTSGSLSLEPPVIGAETISTQYYSSSGVAPADGGLKHQLKQCLKRSTFLRKLKSMKLQGQRKHFTYGSNQYLPILNHFCDLYHSGKIQSDVIPLSLSTAVLQVIDQAKVNNN